ncbi:ABC transporter [Burkholderia multivorans]|uniref:ATP-binding cassette domain-containing protein n=1 Tax=Burkholderia multivorans TaxID=87883 RepID=UPI0007522B35|nr:ATP-binding cassette domain-containing protein [Burkholderia multivorans]KVP22546.1 ABC transporter [Burkholderia multivorans]MDN7653857.1 ATP-binding cassette domain-containing protein [Burkholderia multivorans]
MNEKALRGPERGTIVVDVVGVTRIYRTRRHEGPLWRQLLRPTFDTYTALDDVNLQIRAGECLGLVGPNGAGKSTMIKLLTGLLKPSSGRISVLGHEPGRLSSQFLTQIAAVFGHKTSLWWDLPVRHSFDAIRRIYQVPVDTFREDVALFADMLHIDKLMDRTVRQLSLGERIKCEVVLALAHRPRVLLLDEPTIGVDMESKQQLRTLINRVVEERHVSTLLTTHDVTDLTACCTHIAFIQGGNVFQIEAMDELLRQFGVSRDNGGLLESRLIETFRARGMSPDEGRTLCNTAPVNGMGDEDV